MLHTLVPELLYTPADNHFRQAGLQPLPTPVQVVQTLGSLCHSISHTHCHTISHTASHRVTPVSGPAFPKKGCGAGALQSGEEANAAVMLASARDGEGGKNMVSLCQVLEL